MANDHVIPAQAGTLLGGGILKKKIPAFAGMTGKLNLPVAVFILLA